MEAAGDEQTLKEKALFYTTAFFVLLGTFSLFAFLFLVPFVIDPAFTTIFMEFDPAPAKCVTTDSVNREGTSNCTWTSCREGCTKEMVHCTHIFVNYIKNPVRYVEGQGEKPPAPDLPEDWSTIEWDYQNARVFPNVKGCVYPPFDNCSNFLDVVKSKDSEFECYYSQVEPGVVVTEYSLHKAHMDLVYAIAIPIPCFISAVVYLAFAYFKIYNEEPETQTAVPAEGTENPEGVEGEGTGEGTDGAGTDGAATEGGDAGKEGESRVTFADSGTDQNGLGANPNVASKSELGSPDGSSVTSKYLQPGYLPEKGGKEKLPPISSNDNITVVEVKEAGPEKEEKEKEGETEATNEEKETIETVDEGTET